MSFQSCLFSVSACGPTTNQPLLLVQVYVEPAKTFKTDAVPPQVFTVPVVTKGREALEEINSVGVTWFPGGLGGWVQAREMGLVG